MSSGPKKRKAGEQTLIMQEEEGDMLRMCASLAALLGFVCTAHASETAEKIIAAAKATCADKKGEFKVAKNAITKLDLTGDSRPEEIIDFAKFACSTATSLYGGAGGAELILIVEGSPTHFLAQKWKVVDLDKAKVLLIAVDHSVCGQESDPCIVAYTWNGKSFSGAARDQ
jgi:hypothetical protein